MELSVSAQLPGAGWLTGTGLGGLQPTRRNHSAGWAGEDGGRLRERITPRVIDDCFSREEEGEEERVRERPTQKREGDQWEMEEKWLRTESRERWEMRQTVPRLWGAEQMCRNLTFLKHFSSLLWAEQELELKLGSSYIWKFCPHKYRIVYRCYTMKVALMWEYFVSLLLVYSTATVHPALS